MFEIDKLKGHYKNRELLKKLLREKFVSGTYLFSGMEAIGKKKTALWFAQLVNCREPDAPCGRCLSCRKIDKGVHPDVKLIARHKDKTAITIDQVREEVVSEANFKPLEGRFKVIVIDDAHLLNDQAQNSLLKVTEEPGDRIIIVLVTSRPSELIDTIISRCRILRFQPISKPDMDEILMGIPGITPEKLHLVSATSAGSPGRAVRQAADEKFWKMREKIFALLEILPDGRLEDVLSFCESFSLSRTELSALESLFEILISWFRDLLFVREGMGEENLVNRDFRPALEKVVFCYMPEDIITMQELVLEVRKLVFENNLNIRLGLQRIFIKAKQFGSA